MAYIPKKTHNNIKYIGKCKFCKKEATNFWLNTHMHKSCYHNYIRNIKSQKTIILSNGLECRNDVMTKQILYDN